MTRIHLPTDGIVSQLGVISGDEIFQAKGHNYSASALVGGDKVLAANFSKEFRDGISEPQGLPSVHTLQGPAAARRCMFRLLFSR